MPSRYASWTLFSHVTQLTPRLCRFPRWQVETESYDGMPHVGEDDRWNKFAAFHDYLEKAFPKTHKALKLTKVNSWGLAFEWTGSDPSLKPLLLMGHQGALLPSR